VYVYVCMKMSRGVVWSLFQLMFPNQVFDTQVPVAGRSSAQAGGNLQLPQTSQRCTSQALEPSILVGQSPRVWSLSSKLPNPARIHSPRITSNSHPRDQFIAEQPRSGTPLLLQLYITPKFYLELDSSSLAQHSAKCYLKQRNKTIGLYHY
jgi:hypothetical protein